MTYTHNLNPAVNTSLCPSRLFGGPERLFLTNIVLKPNDPTAHSHWHTIDGQVGNPTLGPLYVAPHVARVVYVSRCVRTIRALALSWDTPDIIYAMGGLLPAGWHECRLVTAELLAELEDRAAAWEATGAGGADEWKRAEVAAKVSDLFAAWQESQLPHAAAVAEQREKTPVYKLGTDVANSLGSDG